MRNRAFVSTAVGVALLICSALAAAIRFDPPVYYPHQGRIGSVALGDVNRDGNLDLVVTPEQFDSPAWFVRLGNGDGTFRAPLPFRTGIGDTAIGLVVADMNRDGFDDVVANTVEANVEVFVSRGDGTFEPALLYPVTSRGADVAVGDLDGDGVRDVLAGHQPRTIAVFLGNGDGSLRRIADADGTYAGAVLAPADYTLDGKLDVFVGAQEPFLYYGFREGRGDGTFGPRLLVPKVGLDITDYVIRAVDLNRDGLLDLLAGHGTFGFDGLTVLLATGPGTWGPETIIPTTGGSVLSLETADFDRDGNQDLVFYNLDRSDDVKLRRGNGDGTFSPDVLVWESGSQWNLHKIATGDLNNDGLPDIVFADWTNPGRDLPRTVVLLNRSGNSPPVAVAGPGQEVECESPSGTLVHLDGSGSSDPDSTPGANDIVSYEWFEGYGTPSHVLVAVGVTAAALFEWGDHEVALVVTDQAGAQATDTTLISVRDREPPTLVGTTAPSYLWPPDHRMVLVQVDFAASDRCDPSPAVTLLSATSSEPDDAPGGSDGHTTGDIQGADIGTPDTEVFLRAERDRRGPGRTYTLLYQALDHAGNFSGLVLPVRVARPPRSANSAPTSGSFSIHPGGLLDVETSAGAPALGSAARKRR